MCYVFQGEKIQVQRTCGFLDPLRSIESGQIIATSHDLTPNDGLVGEILLSQGNLR